MPYLPILFIIFLSGNSIWALNLLQPPQLIFITDEAHVEANEKYVSNGKLKIDNPGTEKSLINYEFRFNEDVPVNCGVRIVLINVQPKKNLTIGKPIVVNICDFIKSDQIFYPGFREKSNFPARCPIRAGIYKIEKYFVPIEKFPPILPTGRYIARLQQVIGKNAIHEFLWLGRVAQRTN